MMEDGIYRFEQGWKDWDQCPVMQTDLGSNKSYTLTTNVEALEPHCLQYLQANMFATALEESIKQLRILDQCNSELHIIKLMSEMEARRRKKFGVQEHPVTDELENIGHKKLDCPEYKLNKLSADRQYCSTVISDTFLDLALNSCYLPLVTANNALEDLKTYRVNLAEEEGKNKTLRRELWKQLRQQRNHFKSVTYDTDVIIDTLRSQVEDAALMTEIRGRYVENWQNARSEQHLQTIAVKEGGSSDSIEYYGQRTDHERRVHSEIELLTTILINETLSTVETWMTKYDTDMEAVDLKIQIKKNDYQNMLDKRKYLETTLEEHKELIENWVKFKEEREKARQYTMKMTNAAIVVQAWWRGLLVRQQLGPFRPKKKPPTAKGKGKK